MILLELEAAIRTYQRAVAGALDLDLATVAAHTIDVDDVNEEVTYTALSDTDLRPGATVTGGRYMTLPPVTLSRAALTDHEWRLVLALAAAHADLFSSHATHVDRAAFRVDLP